MANTRGHPSKLAGAARGFDPRRCARGAGALRHLEMARGPFRSISSLAVRGAVRLTLPLAAREKTFEGIILDPLAGGDFGDRLLSKSPRVSHPNQQRYRDA